MKSIDQALEEIRSLHEQLTHSPAPEIPPGAFLPFPPGTDPVRFAVDEVERLKEMVARVKNDDESTTAEQVEEPCWGPNACVFAGPAGATFHLEIPGVTRENLGVHVSRGELIVRGRRSAPQIESSLQPMVVEQVFGPFERRFPLPAWCTAEHIRARSADGMLEIRIGRSQDDVGPTEFEVEIG